MDSKSVIKEKGRKHEFVHDKSGRVTKVTKQDGKEVKRELTNKRIIFPGMLRTANFGIRQFKRDNPNATHKEIQDFKNGSWAFPPAQMFIENTAVKEKKGKK